MPSKRLSQSVKKSASATLAPKRSRSSKSRLEISSLPAVVPTPIVLQLENKRALILAHAAQRVPDDPLQRASMWVGVGVIFCFVLVVWWWLAKPGLMNIINRPLGDEFNRLVKGEHADSQRASLAWGEQRKELRQLGAQTQVDRQALDRLALFVEVVTATTSTSTASALLFNEVTTATRSDIFISSRPTTTSQKLYGNK